MIRDLRAIPCMLVLILISAIAVPAAAEDLPSETRMAITVTSPQQYDTIWSDLVPPQATVVGTANASRGIRDLVIESSIGQVSCGNGTEFSCSVPVAEGNETITITVIDTYGKTAEAVLNVYVNIDASPPPFIYAIGTVTDVEGHPVPGASVRFESVLPLNGVPHPAMAETDGEGGYLIENAFGYGQNITVEEDGYLPLHREVVFEDLVNRLDLELEPEPQDQTVPGFCAWTGILGLAGGLLAVRAGERRKR
jgi:hypothetical protein